ncbi:MAG: methyltransferase domain-containing protein, partial [Chloroflexota bacterium]
DGTLTGPNFAAVAEVKSHASLPIIASGGVSSISDLEKLSRLGVEGAIVGQALYAGAIDLKEALAALKTEKGHKKVRTHKFDPKRMDFLDSPQRAKQVDMDKIMSLLPLRPHNVVADIGCGTGFFTFPLAQHLPQGRVLALDISPDMLERVKSKVQQSGATNVEARLCQELDFPVAPGSLDGVLLALVLHEQEERTACLQKVRDRLQPGGWVGVVEWVKKPMAEGPPLYERIDPKEGRELATEAGLKVVQKESVGQSFYMLVLEN